jgi:hypothetical protein
MATANVETTSGIEEAFSRWFAETYPNCMSFGASNQFTAEKLSAAVAAYAAQIRGAFLAGARAGRQVTLDVISVPCPN